MDVAECLDPKNNADRLPLYSINLVGWSMPSKIMKTAESFRDIGLPAQYNFAINIFILGNKSYKAKLTCEGEDGTKTIVEGRWSYVGMHLNAHAGKRTPVAPTAVLDDGLLDLCLVSRTSRWYNLKTLALVQSAKHLDRKGVSVTKVKSVLLEPSDNRLNGENSVNVDGEMSGFSPVLVRCLPRKLRVCVME